MYAFPVFSPLLRLIVGLFQYSSHYFLGILGVFIFRKFLNEMLKYGFVLHSSCLILIALLQHSCLSSIMDNFESFALCFFNKFIILIICLAAPGLSSGTHDLLSSVPLMGSSSLTMDRTWAPCIGNTDSASGPLGSSHLHF